MKVTAACEHVMKNFSLEEQELLRASIFTNPGGKTSLVYPQPLVAGEEISPLMSAYSRTHVSMQQRVLEFIDQEKDEMARAALPHLRPLMLIFRESDGTLRVSRKTRDFNEKWVLAHGHSSIKEETAVFGHVEDISDIVGKKITGHPLCKPQVKSTRYLSYGTVLDQSLEDEDLRSLPNAVEVIEHVAWMNQRYQEMTEGLTDRACHDALNQEFVAYLRSDARVAVELDKKIAGRRKKDAAYTPSPSDLEEMRRSILSTSSDETVRAGIEKFILDSSRVYLLAVTKTSLGFSADARTLEEIITDMISSPRAEDRRRGQELWDEAKKIAPVLLGEKSHIAVDDWKVKNESELRTHFQERFDGSTPGKEGKTVDLITPRDMDQCSDRWNAALAVFPYVDLTLVEIYARLDDASAVKNVLERAHEHRDDTHDVLHPAISHSGLVFQLTMGYHGYRDMFRHRRGSRSVQLLTTRLGFEVPATIRMLGMDTEYLRDMRRCAEVYEAVRRHSPHLAEKVVPFGALCRALHSWQVNQVGYIAALRTRIKTGNASYVETTREMVRKVADLMPETARFFRYDSAEYPPQLWKNAYGWYDTEKRGTERIE